MSSEQDYTTRHPLPPPPTSNSPRLPALGQAQQTSPLRRIAVQPPRITTALAQPQGGTFLFAPTPASATSLSLPFSPHAPTSATYAASPVSSPMAMRNTSSAPYNPQQWGRNGPVGGAYAPYTATQTPTATTRPSEMTGMEASMPSPPPPYSPAQSQNLSQAVGTSPHLSGSTFTPSQHPPTGAHPLEYVPSASSRTPSASMHHRPGSVGVPSSATGIAPNPHFPPPPPRKAGERSASRDKLHSKFSLSAFRNRNADHSPAPSAIESLRINTSDALSRAPGSPGLPGASHTYLPSAFPDRRWSPESQSPIRPPGSRRAASAGALGLASGGRTPVEYSPVPPQGGWGSGIPLPPPPPGPPPNGSRSQSLGRSLESGSSRNSVILPAPPTRRPGQSTLTPIPPTPIGWQEEQSRTRSRSPAVYGLHIDTSPQAIESPEQQFHQPAGEDASVSSGPTASTSHSNSTSYRTSTKSDNSTRGIRERRSESRVARERAEPNNNPWAQDLEAASAKPADLVLGTPEGSLARRNAVGKGTPRSAGARNSLLLDDPGSSNSTPRNTSARRVISGSPAPTPPFSPGTDSPDHQSRKILTALSSKALPTPPLRQYGDNCGSSLTSPLVVANRARSHSSLLSESRPEDSSSYTTPKNAGHDNFVEASMERHRRFIEKEQAAPSDTERLEIFAEFIVAESRLRRDRYSAAFDAMASDVLDLTRDLWRSYGTTGRRSVTPSASGMSIPNDRKSQASTVGESPDTRLSTSITTTAASPSSSIANFTPHTEPASPSSATSQRGRDQAWNQNFQPSLSPIQSIAMSTVPDEDSRGRSASRWWEASNDGASTGIGSRKLERSKRESKYMSLPKEARESLQWAGDDGQTLAYQGSPSGQRVYGPNEYPPEKTGLHEEVAASSTSFQSYYPSSAPSTPDPRKLDVSRLVTLPPSYPRHHPAVNNNHPDLASIRGNLRALSDLQEIKTVKESFNTKNLARKESERTSLTDRTEQLRYNVQENVRNGVMTYADAANAEADFETREQKLAQDAVQGVFDTFQTEVANSLHALLSERIIKASASIEHLNGRLANDAQEVNPNKMQEEGDEQPELLEMLTLLKWLFEAREQLHKEMFELEDERNDLYKDIIVLPYIQTKNEQKVKEAIEFFSRDAQDRKVVYEKEILKRYEEFMDAIEQNVTRGVEAQLSAFWDIAPGLLAIVQKVPQRLQGSNLLIPPQEYDENPAYTDFPLQYLYSLLAHAGRSAYQFIESQINLLCLMHEVKTGVMNASSRLLETQRTLNGEDATSLDREMRFIREDEGKRLTDDLKDKVGLVESQWREALGDGLEACKQRVESFLVKQGGWDESLKE